MSESFAERFEERMKDVDSTPGVRAPGVEGVVVTLQGVEARCTLVTDYRTVLKPGASPPSAVLGVDSQKRQIFLSVKAKVKAESRAAMGIIREHEMAQPGPKTNGDLIKQKIGKQGLGPDCRDSSARPFAGSRPWCLNRKVGDGYDQV